MTEALERELAAMVRGEVRFDSGSRALYATDASNYRQPNAPESTLVEDPAEQQKIWTLREAGLGATARERGENVTWEGWEDAAVPPDQLDG